MNAPTYRTVDIVAGIRAYFDILTEVEADRDSESGGLGFMRFLAEKFPKAYKEDIVRAWAVYQDEFRQEQLENEAETAEAEAMCKIMERAGAGPDMTYQGALQKLSAQGDAEAIQRLHDLQSAERNVFMTLFEAAVKLHPAWESDAPGIFTCNEEQGGPPTAEALVDWFQSTHPLQALRIEDHYRAT